jgi:serine/threonine protein kinase
MSLVKLEIALPPRMHFAGKWWRGGHSLVVLVFHEEYERRLVLKRLTAYDEDVKSRLVRESDIMRVLYDAAPRYFLKFIDCRTDDPDGPWLLMEYAEGGSLRERMDEAARRPDSGSTLPFAESYAYVCQTARAVDVTNDSGIVHGDVKPGNTLLRGDGSIGLSDFGIARRPPETDEMHPLYSRGYVSPEVLKALRLLREQQAPSGELHGFEIKGRDRYAASTIAYELLAGRRPFTGADEAIDQEPPDPRTFNGALGPETAEVLMRGVAAKVENRPARQWDFAVELGQALVADGLLSSNQLIDAQASAPEPSHERIETARQSQAVRDYSHDPTITRAPRHGARRWRAVWGVPHLPSVGRGRIRHSLNGFAVVAVLATLSMLAAWSVLPAFASQAWDVALNALSSLEKLGSEVLGGYSVGWPLLIVAGASLLTAVVSRRSPRVLLGVVAVGAIALGLQTSTEHEPSVGRAKIRHLTTLEAMPQTKPQLARHKRPKKTRTATANQHRVGGSRGSVASSSSAPTDTAGSINDAESARAPVSPSAPVGKVELPRKSGPCGCGGFAPTGDGRSPGGEESAPSTSEWRETEEGEEAEREEEGEGEES